MGWTPKLGIFYDAEFTGLHKDTTLISIGMISQSKQTFYAEFTDYDTTQVDDWVNENVISHLLFRDEKEKYTSILKDSYRDLYSITLKGDTKFVKRELIKWLKKESTFHKKQIQFFVDCYAYDWMLLNKLLAKDGNAINIPKYIYYIPVDLSSVLYFAGVDPDINREEFARVEDNEEYFKHNALYDATIASICYSKIHLKDATVIMVE
jgi:hypothetical protein